MKMGMRAAVWVVAAMPVAAWGQMTGVSHPEEIPVTTSPEGISQPVVYEAPASVVIVPATPAPKTPVLKERATEKPAVEASAVEPTLGTPAMAPAISDGASAGQRDDDTQLTTRSKAGDPDEGIVVRVPGASNELPAGTMMKVRLEQEVSTSLTRVGTVFTAELLEPLERDGKVLLPAGSIVHGKVTDVHGGTRATGAAAIHLQPQNVTLPDGTRYALRAQVIDTGMYHSTKVDEEGTIVRRDHATGTLAAVGLATGSGAAAGAVFGGWPGALIGAGIGAGVSTVVWLRQDHQEELRAGTVLTLGLTGGLFVGN